MESSGSKWLIWAVVVIVILGGVYWYWSSTQAPAGTPVQNPSGASNTASNSGLPTAQNDTSDAAMNQDTAAIDASMQAYNSDSSNVDTTLNDKPVQQ